MKDIQTRNGFTAATGINDAGVVVGDTGNTLRSPAFIRATNGTITLFSAPAATKGTFAIGINDSSMIAGSYDTNNGASHSFIRAADGKVLAFDPPGETNSVLTALSGEGAVTGYVLGANGYAGYVRSAKGAFVTFKVPGATGTLPSGINAAGVVAGSTQDKNFNLHGFQRTP